jgi:hypothetical protein
MTTAVNSPTNELPPPTSPPQAPPAGPTPPPTDEVPAGVPERGTHVAWHIVAIVVGVLALLPGFGMLAGGTTLVVANAASDDGYFDVTLDRLHADGVAIATIDLWNEAGQDEDWPWVLDFLDVDVRLRVDGAADTYEVFVGIARTPDVEAYLSDAEYSQLFDFDHRSPVYRTVEGVSVVATPADQDFWTASTVGDGEQELEWEARGGRWSVVVMNADGTSDVTADVQVGVHSGAIVPIGVTLIVVGGIVFLGSISLIVIGARGRRTN